MKFHSNYELSPPKDFKSSILLNVLLYLQNGVDQNFNIKLLMGVGGQTYSMPDYIASD